MNGSELSCQEDLRREDVRAASLFGLDYVEVGSPEGPDDQRTITVFFLGKAPKKFEMANLVLTGGRRIRDVRITDLRVVRLKDATLDDYLEVEVSKSGDFSPYTLSVVETDALGRSTDQPMAGFDSRYNKVTFSFKARCPSDLDCKQPCGCPPPERNEPDINYLAKDYASFRQLMLDRLSLIMPDWSETRVPDIGVTLVELLAYTGDYLSYYQDAVATEAYLGTARERISVRRHARLVDYAMHEGCNARAWMTVWTSDKIDFDPAQIFFITQYPNAPENRLLSTDDLRNIPSSNYEIFEPLTVGTGVAAPPGGQTITFYPAHNRISFYTWGDCECCLPRGATSATLVDQWVLPPTPPPPPPGTTGGTGTGTTGTPGTPGTTGTTPTTGRGQTRGTPQTPNQPSAAARPAKLAAPDAKKKSGAGDKSSASLAAPSPVATAGQKKVVAAAESAPPAPGEDAPPGTERLLKLKVGDVLIFEEVKGAKNGTSNDADPRHRQAVRLTKVTPIIDPLYHPYKDTFDKDTPGKQYGQPVVEIEWDSEDALTFPLCISVKAPAPQCDCMEDVSIALGNVILIDAGGDTSETLGIVPTQSTNAKCPSCCQPGEVSIVPGLFRPPLTQQPLTFSQPLSPPCSATDFMDQDPRQALPWISLVSIPPGPSCSAQDTGISPEHLTSAQQADNNAQPPCEIAPLFTFDDLVDPAVLAKKLKNPGQDVSIQFLLARLGPAARAELNAWDGISALSAVPADLSGMLETWQLRLDLLESGPDDRVFVVETDNQGFAHLRFGNGFLGRQPEAGTLFRADYRVGNGRVGNVGAETITYMVIRNEKVSGITFKPVNPMPATGGQEPEPIDDVKLFAPHAFKATLERAVTAADYSAIAGDNGRRLLARSALEAMNPAICAQPFRRLQQTKAALRWNGSWYTAQVALDPADSEDSDAELITEITDYLAPFRRMGHDLVVGPARYVPLSVAVTVCVLPNYLRGHVESAVLDVLSNRRLSGGRLGFFHPDNLSFGDGIYVSRLLAAVQAVPGVQDVTVNELERFESSEPAMDIEDDEVPSNSVFALGPMEIARLDNDPDFPENGRLVVTMRGGR